MVSECFRVDDTDTTKIYKDDIIYIYIYLFLNGGPHKPPNSGIVPSTLKPL